MGRRTPRIDAQSKRCRGGWAYMWMLIVVALTGLAGTAALEIDGTIGQREREKELLFIGHQFRAALQRYREKTPAGSQVSPYPATFDELMDDRRSGTPYRHLRRVYVDPMTGKAQWGIERLQGRIVGIYSLSTRRPIKRDGFEQEDAAFKNASSYNKWKFFVSPEVQVGDNR